MKWINRALLCFALSCPAIALAETPQEASMPEATVSQTAPINLNSASATELTRLSGIGPVKAEAIVRFREEHGPFERVDDLTAVRGIGAATLEKNRHLLAVD